MNRNWRPQLVPTNLLRRPAIRVLLGRVVALAVTLGLSACGDTVGNEVSFRFAVSTATESGKAPGVFTTTTGWDVTLDEAIVAIGPVYLHENSPHLASGATSRFRNGLGRLASLLVRPAYAHAGDDHFEGGAVLGEWLEQHAIDLTAPGLHVLGESVGDEATVRAYTVQLDPPRAPIVRNGDPTRGFPVYVSGEAVKDGVTVRFRGGLTLTSERRRVEGLATEITLAEGGTFVLELHPRAWFDAAHFERLPESTDPDGYRTITTDNQVHAAWMIGARSTRAFSTRWLPAGEDGT